MNFHDMVVYKEHRIHASRLCSDVWVVSIVASGNQVTHLRGEFASRGEGLTAAKRHIDQRGNDTTKLV